MPTAPTFDSVRRAPPAPGGVPAPPRLLARLLERADVRVDGSRAFDLQVHHPRVYRRVLTNWTLGLGDAYVDGDWDCERLDELFTRLLRADLDRDGNALAHLWAAGLRLRERLRNAQRPARAFIVGERHYDIGNDLYACMLDSRMTYSCGYWERAADLEQAQTDKLEMIARKLQLAPGQRVLEIGCGWGGLARHLALHHGVEVTGLTVSRAQQALAEEACKGLPVRILLQDYRAATGRYDRIVSVGMFEHVGPKNHAAYFDTAWQRLEPQGLFLLHTIGLDRPGAGNDPWIERHIFPGGRLPAPQELAEAASRRFVIEDWHNFGPDYDRTLMSWHARVEAAWPQLAPRYGERFRRMWRYYLLSCAGFFRSRQGQLWQLVLSRRERAQPYRSWRPFSR
jgi:cyclopropane-fatty-acyl-phospholipid synthase